MINAVAGELSWWSDLGDEAAVEADYERVVGEREDVALSKHLFDLIAKYEMMFEKSLHRKQLPRLLVSDQVHAPVSHRTHRLHGLSKNRTPVTFSNNANKADPLLIILVQKITNLIFIHYISVFILRSTASGTLLVPRARTASGQRSFAVNGPRTWNSLPADLRTPDTTLCSFKRHLKAHLFQQ